MTIRPGWDDKNNKRLPYPAGAIPRLLIVYPCREAKCADAKGDTSGRIDLGHSLRSFMLELGLVQSRTKEAVAWLEKARNGAPAHPNIRAHLASAYALAGDAEHAAAELAEARRLSADDRYSSLARLRADEDFEALAPGVGALLEATYIAGLRKAGMAEV